MTEEEKERDLKRIYKKFKDNLKVMAFPVISSWG